MATIKNKVNFVTKSEEGEPLNLCVCRPDHKVNREANAIYAKTWRESAESKSFVLRESLKGILRDQKVWDDERESRYLDLQVKIRAAETALKAGGKKLSEAKKLAIDLRGFRFDLRNLLAETNKYDENTVEAQAENARFDFFCSKCILNPANEGNPYFASHDDYLGRKTEQAAFDGANELAKMMFGVDADFQKKLPENQFLTKFGFVDERLRLINKEGKLVDSEGRLVDENGRYIKEDGTFVNAGGDSVDEDGNLVVQSLPFLDEEGNPLVEEVVPPMALPGEFVISSKTIKDRDTNKGEAQAPV